MRISKLLGPVFFALAMAAAAGCATETDDDTAANEITGSVQQARLQRIRQAYADAKVEDFTEIQPLMDDAALAAWNVDIQDPHWFSFQVDGRAVFALDFIGDTNAVLTGAAPAAGGATEEFVVIFDATGAGNTASYNAVLLYRADTDQWGGLTRVLKDAKPNHTADGGVAMPDGGTHSADGGTPHHPDGGADGGSHFDGGADGGSHADGGTHSDGGADGGSHSDGGTHSDGGVILDAGPG